MDGKRIDMLLKKLAEVYEAIDGQSLIIFVCGGAALSMTCLVERTTKDIDLVAPPELPKEFFEAADMVAKEFSLPDNWINQGPKELSEMGLPEGFEKRAHKKKYGKRLTVCFASRRDLIFFKTYASVDRAGYHVDDLLALNPTTDELIDAAKWCMQHDVSEAFKELIKNMFTKLGFEDASRSI